MDRRRPRALRRAKPAVWPGLIATAGGLILLLAGAAEGLAPKAFPLRALRWVAADADPVKALTHQPAECLAIKAHGAASYGVEVGRAAFRTPLLLGGQAARAGLSCESCHRNGRANPNFFFPGLSGAPGTADVTSALFSMVRDDGVDNPRTIPDLGGDKRRLKIDQGGDGAALRTFIRGLVVDEFAGAEPPPAVLDGLVAYVRALDPRICAGRGEERLRAALTVSDATRAARAGLGALERGDVTTAVLMVEAARSRLGQLDERYAATGLETDRAAIRTAALNLGDILSRVRASDPLARFRLMSWLADVPRWASFLARDEHRSFYAERPLRAAMGLASDDRPGK